MEELRQQLGEALPTAMAAAATGMGRTTEELIKLVETGSVRFPAFARGLTRGFEEMQAGVGKLADTSQQAFARLGNAWTQLRDTIANSGLNQYLVTVANNLREAVEWTNRLAKGSTGAQPVRLCRTSARTAAQTQERARLQRLVDTYERQITPSTSPAMRAQREEMIANAKEMIAQLDEGVRTTADQAAQAKVTQETNKTAAALELQQDYLDGIRKTLQDNAKEVAAFQARAAQAPNVFGAPGGTPEQQMEYARRQRQLREEQTEKLTEQVRQAPLVRRCRQTWPPRCVSMMWQWAISRRPRTA